MTQKEPLENFRQKAFIERKGEFFYELDMFVDFLNMAAFQKSISYFLKTDILECDVIFPSDSNRFPTIRVLGVGTISDRPFPFNQQFVESMVDRIEFLKGSINETGIEVSKNEDDNLNTTYSFCNYIGDFEPEI